MRWNMRQQLAVITLVMSASVVPDVCHAQGLFGQRDLGRPVSRRNSPRVSAEEVGTVTAGRRFLRDERSITDFVGSTASGGGAAGFVGGQSAVTAAVSSITGLREEVRPPVNRPRVVRQAGLYAERLQLAPGTLPPAPGGDAVLVSAPLSTPLQSLMESRGLTLEVSPADRQAILRGVVSSAEDRQKFELLVLLEPGIQTVVNQLTVNPSVSPPAPPEPGDERPPVRRRQPALRTRP